MSRKIPYGLSDYKKLAEENYVYVDKTRYIEVLESLNTEYPIFLRPLRFGKSLFVSTLQYYYDIECAEEFDALFTIKGEGLMYEVVLQVPNSVIYDIYFQYYAKRL